MYQVNCLTWLQTKMAFSSSFLKHIALALCVLMLTACGFRLKQASNLPPDLQSLTLNAADPQSDLYRQLKKQLQHAEVVYSGEVRADRAQLLLLKDKLDRRTLSLFNNGQVAEYELTYSVSYQVTRPGQDPITQYFELYRNYQDDPDSALAKAKELELILSEMRLQASRRIIRELAQL